MFAECMFSVHTDILCIMRKKVLLKNLTSPYPALMPRCNMSIKLIFILYKKKHKTNKSEHSETFLAFPAKANPRHPVNQGVQHQNIPRPNLISDVYYVSIVDVTSHV